MEKENSANRQIESEFWSKQSENNIPICHWYNYPIRENYFISDSYSINFLSITQSLSKLVSRSVTHPLSHSFKSFVYNFAPLDSLQSFSFDLLRERMINLEI